MISICIPSYKRPHHLKRLLDSVSIQTYNDFEVIVTDDSPGLDIKELCAQYQGRFPLSYHRNPSALGTPENWNEAMRKASGEWIKLMHDDDWFADETSLGAFAEAAGADPSAFFIFSAYRRVQLDTQSGAAFFMSAGRYKTVLKNPVTLFASNIIGPPSVVLHKNDGSLYYDSSFKWVVDIDFYIRCLAHGKPHYIKKALINFGVGEQQVTLDCFLQRPVEIPENFRLMNKTGIANLKNIIVYDGWWRLMRNLEIQSVQDIRDAGYTGSVPSQILSMIRWQRKLPRILLRLGFFSKAVMALNYVFSPRITLL